MINNNFKSYLYDASKLAFHIKFPCGSTEQERKEFRAIHKVNAENFLSNNELDSYSREFLEKTLSAYKTK